MTTVLHIISGLKVGGAETMLHRLVKKTRGNKNFRAIIVALDPDGGMRDQFIKDNIELYVYNFKRNPISEFRRLIGFLRFIRPDLVQTWMYHADLIGGWAAWFAGRIPVIWGIHTLQIKHGVSKMTCVFRKLSAWSSYIIPTRILCVADAARQAHARVGYDINKCVVLPNGFDVDEEPLNLDERESLRSALGVSADEMLVGVVGRFNPDKDYRNFLEAALQVLTVRDRVKFLMVGREVDIHNQEINNWIQELGLPSERFIRLGARSDVLKLLSALDVFCSSSQSEAFPLVVGEAMLMAKPCVATDVGDTARLLGTTGILVPPRNATELARGMLQILGEDAEERLKLGAQARARVVDEFSMQCYVEKLENLYGAILAE